MVIVQLCPGHCPLGLCVPTGKARPVQTLGEISGGDMRKANDSFQGLPPCYMATDASQVLQSARDRDVPRQLLYGPNNIVNWAQSSAFVSNQLYLKQPRWSLLRQNSQYVGGTDSHHTAGRPGSQISVPKRQVLAVQPVRLQLWQGRADPGTQKEAEPG